MNQLLPHLGVVVGLQKANWYNGRIVKVETKEDDRIQARMIHEPSKVVKILPDNILTGDAKDAKGAEGEKKEADKKEDPKKGQPEKK